MGDIVQVLKKSSVLRTAAVFFGQHRALTDRTNSRARAHFSARLQTGVCGEPAYRRGSVVPDFGSCDNEDKCLVSRRFLLPHLPLLTIVYRPPASDSRQKQDGDGAHEEGNQATEVVVDRQDRCQSCHGRTTARCSTGWHSPRAAGRTCPPASGQRRALAMHDCQSAEDRLRGLLEVTPPYLSCGSSGRRLCTCDRFAGRRRVSVGAISAWT